MKPYGDIKRVFPGGNTAKGFYSFYKYIITEDAKRIFIIKGGPGVGKSSFMKNIAAEMIKRGFPIEMHHCSSDNNSIDGIVIIPLNIALIDGTAPHILDPANPGCVDEIIHFGDYWDEKRITMHKKAIIACNKEIGRLFTQAYRMLHAASIIKKAIVSMYREATEIGLYNQITAELMRELFDGMEIARTPGQMRHLFASAITPDGTLNYLDTVLGRVKKLYLINGHPGVGKSFLISKLAYAALEYGFNVEAYHCSLDPKRIEHLLIPGLSVGITTPTKPQILDLAGAEIIDLNEGLNCNLLQKYITPIRTQEELFMNLLNNSISFIKQAKDTHDEMESYYIPNMNFTAIEELKEKILERILSY